jgi:hypothetical protein
MLFVKDTFKTDLELNKFFESHRDIRIIKFIIAGGEFHLIYTKDRRLDGTDHLSERRPPIGQRGRVRG